MSNNKEIRFSVTEEEREIISRNAKIFGMKNTPYAKKAALNPTIIYFDYSAIERHTRMLGQIVNSINRLIFTIDLNNDYLPKEIDGIVDYIEKIWKTENELLREVRNQWIKANKQK